KITQEEDAYSVSEAKRGKTSGKARCRACVAEANRIRRYNLKKGQYTEIVDTQNGECAICGVILKRKNTGDAWSSPVVDHDHKSGAVRGVLCQECNLALGHLADDPMIIARACSYILKHAQS